jgi:hypothetical protein
MSTKSILQNQLLNQQESTVIDTLLYFDIFHYPLTSHEIQQFSANTQIKDEQLLEQVLDALVSRKLIYKLGKYYSLENEHTSCTKAGGGKQKGRRNHAKSN